MKKLSMMLLASMLTVTMAQAEMKCGAGQCGSSSSGVSMKCGASMNMDNSDANSQLMSDMHKDDGYVVKVISSKSLIVGSNEIKVVLQKDGKIINDAKVKVKFFMPEMPGMPYMEYKEKLKLDGNSYKGNVNLSMSGTWQYHLKFKTADGEKHKVRGSVNL